MSGGTRGIFDDKIHQMNESESNESLFKDLTKVGSGIVYQRGVRNILCTYIK
jgi:hypothetical protein